MRLIYNLNLLIKNKNYIYIKIKNAKLKQLAKRNDQWTISYWPIVHIKDKGLTEGSKELI